MTSKPRDKKSNLWNSSNFPLKLESQFLLESIFKFGTKFEDFTCLPLHIIFRLILYVIYFIRRLQNTIFRNVASNLLSIQKIRSGMKNEIQDLKNIFMRGLFYFT